MYRTCSKIDEICNEKNKFQYLWVPRKHIKKIINDTSVGINLLFLGKIRDEICNNGRVWKNMQNELSKWRLTGTICYDSKWRK